MTAQTMTAQTTTSPTTTSPTTAAPTTAPPTAPAGTVLDLLERARGGLLMACHSSTAAERYTQAHLSALRAGAALLAARSAPSRRARPRSVWEVLPTVAPELTEWASFFAAGAAKRAAAEAGSTRAVSEREADDLVRDADRFLAVVEEMLGLVPHAAVPSSWAVCQSAPTRRAG